MIEARCGIATCRLIGCDMKEASAIFRAQLFAATPLYT